MKKLFLTFVALALISHPFWAQQMGPQDRAQLDESPAGSKVILFLKWINEENSYSEQNIRQLISDRLVDKYGFEGLKELMEDVQANSGQLSLFEADRTGMFEYQVKLKASAGEEWIDGKVKLESKSPYRIDGFELDMTQEGSSNQEPLYAPGKTKKSKKQTRKKASFNEVASEAKKIAQAYHDLGWFSGVVMLAREGKPFYQEAFGLADEANKTPNTVNTKFRIGSINKDYTALLVLQQAERGTFSLDDKLAKFDLGFPAEVANKITVRQLLNHTAGFSDIFIPEYLNNIRAYKNINDILPLLREAPLAYEPGTDQRYSNYGYIVLGAILEKETGKSFGQLLQDNIFSVTGLTNTHYDIAENIEGEAQSYRFTLEGKKADHTTQLEYPTPDGGMYATASDLLQFFQATFFTNQLISDASKMTFVNDFQSSSGNWEKVLNSPNNGIGLAGGGPGVSAVVDIEWKDRLSIIVLANTDGNIAEAIARRILRVYQGRNYQPIQLPATNFAYQLFKEKGKKQFAADFQSALKEAGYGQANPSILNQIGYSLMRQKAYDEAIAIFQMNVDLFPKEANPYDSLGEAYLNAGNKDKALEYYQKALEIDPNFPSAVKMVAELTGN